MRVLFICNKSPFPPREGGPLAMNANIQSLLKVGHQVKVLALNTNKYFTKDSDIPDSYRKQTGYPTCKSSYLPAVCGPQCM